MFGDQLKRPTTLGKDWAILHCKAASSNFLTQTDALEEKNGPRYSGIYVLSLFTLTRIVTCTKSCV